MILIKSYILVQRKREACCIKTTETVFFYQRNVRLYWLRSPYDRKL